MAGEGRARGDKQGGTLMHTAVLALPCLLSIVVKADALAEQANPSGLVITLLSAQEDIHSIGLC